MEGIGQWQSCDRLGRLVNQASAGQADTTLHTDNSYQFPLSTDHEKEAMTTHLGYDEVL
jgi:hypothetical protein